jgi:hypothetical protein
MSDKRESGPKVVEIHIPSVTQVTVGSPDIDTVIAAVLEGPFPDHSIDADKAFEEVSLSQRMTKAIRRLSNVITIKEKEVERPEMRSEDIIQVNNIYFVQPDIDTVVQEEKENVPIDNTSHLAKDIDDLVNEKK